MGVRLIRLPDYLHKWLAPSGFGHRLVNDWQTRSRSSGDFDEIMGVGVHHAADSTGTTLAATELWATVTAPDRPIGNGTVTRTRYGPIFSLWAVRATNTQGKGGPVLTSRGVIPLDSGNRRMFSIEAMNNGVGEPWDDRMCDLYVLVVCAVIDCTNATQGGTPLGAGDVFAHFEWAPTRKNDPAGPCRWNGQRNARWNMDAFRGEVFHRLTSGPTDAPPPPPEDEVTEADKLQIIAGVVENMRAALTEADFVGQIINYPVPVPGGGTADLWSVIVDNRQRTMALQDTVAQLRTELDTVRGDVSRLTDLADGPK
jgi:hypothetical protein